MNAPIADLTMFPRRRIRRIQQSEASECGLAALAMIANWHGHDVDLGALRRRFGVTMRGITLPQLMRTADTMGLTPRPLKLGVGNLKALQLPAILHWDQNHFVVLERVAGERAYIVDPGVDGRWHDADSLSRHFTGVALELRPSTTFEPERSSRLLRLRNLWTSAPGLRRSLIQTVILSIVLQAHVLAAPYFLQLAVDDALPALDDNLLVTLALGFGLFALISAGATLLRSFVLLASGTAMSFGISSNIARKLMRLPIHWFERRSVGDILSRFQSVAPIQKLLTESAGGALVDGLLAILTFALMIAYSPTLTLVPLTGILLYGGIKALTLDALRHAENDQIVHAGKEQGTMIETLRGIVTLRLAGRETMRHAVWQNRLSEHLSATFSAERIKAHQAALAALIAALENVVLIWLATRHAISGGFSIGMIFAFLTYRLQFATATRSLVDAVVSLRMLRPHLDRLADIALEPDDEGFGEQAIRDPEDFRGEIRLRGVAFAYGPHEPAVLECIDLHILPGEHVAITGPSGGGKTTLTKIILGLIDPTAGEVLIDGIPLGRYGRRAFRENVGAVLQDDVLFAGSIADNVAGFDEIDAARLAEALESAAIAEDVARMPMRHLTMVGDMGSALSGGQRQRILLARALYRRPKLLVMDEGTAHLDVALEDKVNSAISAMGITRIVVAHRHETIAAADRVILIKEGCISNR